MACISRRTSAGRAESWRARTDPGQNILPISVSRRATRATACSTSRIPGCASSTARARQIHTIMWRRWRSPHIRARCASRSSMPERSRSTDSSASSARARGDCRGAGGAGAASSAGFGAGLAAASCSIAFSGGGTSMARNGGASTGRGVSSRTAVGATDGGAASSGATATATASGAAAMATIAGWGGSAVAGSGPGESSVAGVWGVPQRDRPGSTRTALRAGLVGSGIDYRSRYGRVVGAVRRGIVRCDAVGRDQRRIGALLEERPRQVRRKHLRQRVVEGFVLGQAPAFPPLGFALHEALGPAVGAGEHAITRLGEQAPQPGQRRFHHISHTLTTFDRERRGPSARARARLHWEKAGTYRLRGRGRPCVGLGRPQAAAASTRGPYPARLALRHLWCAGSLARLGPRAACMPRHRGAAPIAERRGCSKRGETTTSRFTSVLHATFQASRRVFEPRSVPFCNPCSETLRSRTPVRSGAHRAGGLACPGWAGRAECRAGEVHVRAGAGATVRTPLPQPRPEQAAGHGGLRRKRGLQTCSPRLLREPARKRAVRSTRG